MQLERAMRELLDKKSGDEQSIRHALNVESRCKRMLLSDEARALALVHEIEWLDRPISPIVDKAHALFRRKPGEAYYFWIDRIKRNQLASRVMVANLMEELAEISPYDGKRQADITRRQIAIERLSGVELFEREKDEEEGSQYDRAVQEVKARRSAASVRRITGPGANLWCNR